MGKVLACLAIFSIVLTGAVDAGAQFAPFDNPPMRRLLRGLPQVQNPESLTDRPTINCSNLRNSVAQILCSGREGAAADWAVNSASWAYLHHIGDAGKAAFEAEQTEWRNSVVQRCSLPALFDPAFVSKRESLCVVSMFQQRARQIRSRLPAEALAEARLAPEQRASIQQQLIDAGFLTGTADGEFGPLPEKPSNNIRFHSVKALPDFTRHERRTPANLFDQQPQRKRHQIFWIHHGLFAQALIGPCTNKKPKQASGIELLSWKLNKRLFADNMFWSLNGRGTLGAKRRHISVRRPAAAQFR